MWPVTPSLFSGSTSIPVRECTENGKPGYQYGDSGACYTYPRGDEAARRKAKQRAHIQAAAIEANQRRRGETPKAAPATQEFVKFVDQDLTSPDQIAPEVLAQIEKYAGEPVPADQVLVRYAHLANDQYDRSHERFPVEYLHRFKATMHGKSLLPGHDRSAVPLGVWLEGEVIKDDQGAHHLKLPFYMDARSEMARRVRLGIAKKVSISFKAPGRTCDLCGQDYDGQNGCENGHKKGQTYDGKLCTVTYSGDPARVEAMEGSLVWLACQYGAEVTGAKAPEDEELMNELEELKAKVAALEDDLTTSQKKAAESEALAKEGQEYRAYLKGEIIRKMTAGMADRPQEAETKAATLTAMLANADLEQLRNMDKVAQAEFDQKFPPSTQSHQLGNEPGRAAPAPATGMIPPAQSFKFDPHGSLRRAS